jgi:CheY-like chemotaxis protein
MLSMLLRSRGFNVDDAVNGKIAVKKVEADILKYGVVFMDNTMPIMNGVEAARALRNLGFPNLIVGVTGNALDDDVQAFITAGADIVFYKPLRIGKLTTLLEYIQQNGFKSDSTTALNINEDVFIERLVKTGTNFSTVVNGAAPEYTDICSQDPSILLLNSVC